jgi:hypothetical protein
MQRFVMSLAFCLVALTSAFAVPARPLYVPGGLPPAPPTAPKQGSLPFGPDGVARTEGMLDANDPFNQQQRRHKEYTIHLEQGQKYQIDLMSDQFDTYLFLLNDAKKLLASDDDGGEGLNSRLFFSPPQTGMYRIQASCFGGTATGRYSLIVRKLPAGQ